MDTEELLDKRFGRLVVISFFQELPKSKTEWLCQCDCGNLKIVQGSSLRNKLTRSCGCLKNKHGLHGIRAYRSWINMRQRCSNPNVTYYHIYGGRGIRVCARWDSFENFYADMGDRPNGTSIDRINSDGDYEPGNCRWATPQEQTDNRRINDN